MNKKVKNTQSSISTEIVPNNEPAKDNSPTNLTGFYAHYYKVLFNKLPIEEQEQLLINLKKPNRIIRGEPIEYPNVRNFVRAVIEKAEEEFDKYARRNQKPNPVKSTAGK